MFERYTEKSIKVIMLAQEEARRLSHNYVGSEMLLLGLVGEGTGIAAKVLKDIKVDLTSARREVEKFIGRGLGPVSVDAPLTPGMQRVLELAWDEARQLGHNYIGTEHLLLGLIREGVGAHVLNNLGVDLTKIRSRVLNALGEKIQVSVAPGPPPDQDILFKQIVDENWQSGINKLIPEVKNFDVEVDVLACMNEIIKTANLCNAQRWRIIGYLSLRWGRSGGKERSTEDFA